MPPPAMPTGARPPDPLVSARYKAEFPKLTGVFTDITLASSAVSQVNYQYTGPDGQPTFTTQPGQRTPATITLKRGMTNDLSAWSWHQEVLQGRMSSARSNGTISILDSEGKPAATFNVINAWPMKIDLSPLASAQSAAGSETITLACESFERAS
jgi:phage tail-like protein